MKFSIFLVLFSNFLFAQTEQISLDFFAENLLPKIKNAKVFYDGKERKVISVDVFNRSYKLEGDDAQVIDVKDV